mgnify:CR=1 FL=1
MEVANGFAALGAYARGSVNTAVAKAPPQRIPGTPGFGGTTDAKAPPQQDDPWEGTPAKLKEADRINSGNWPNSVAAYKNWRVNLLDEVMAASGRPSEALKWILSVETCPDPPLLSDSDYPFDKPTGFATLDAKLSAALTKITTGKFAKTVQLH